MAAKATRADGIDDALLDLKWNIRVADIKLLSYNIHKGFSTNQKFVLTLMREALRKTDADLVFLQEVLGHHDHPERRIASWPTTAQFEFLADSVWSHYAYGKNAIYSEGHHGNAILSKYPIIKWSNLDISNSRLEKRGLLYALIQTPTCEVHCICLHLDLMESGRQAQLERVSTWIHEHVPAHAPLIIAGDFNDWRQKASLQFEANLGLEEVFAFLDGAHAKTFPSFWPALRLDRIYFRNAQPGSGIRMRGDPWKNLSDHIPLYAEMKLK